MIEIDGLGPKAINSFFEYLNYKNNREEIIRLLSLCEIYVDKSVIQESKITGKKILFTGSCLLYTSPSPRDLSTSRMPSSA